MNFQTQNLLFAMGNKYIYQHTKFEADIVWHWQVIKI